MSDEMFYICEWCPEEYCGKTKHELVIVDGKRICYECMEAEYSEEPEHEVFVPAHETRIADLERQLAEIERRSNHAIGWMYAEACSSLDRGEDIRKINFPDIITRMDSEIEEQDK